MLPMGYEKYWKDLKKVLYDVAFNGRLKTKVDLLDLIQWCVVRNYMAKSADRVDLRALNGLLLQIGADGLAAILNDIAPFIALSALQVDMYFAQRTDVSPLVAQKSGVLELTRNQATSILAHCFLCSMPIQKGLKTMKFHNFYPWYSGGFTQLFASKILFMLNYFATVKAIEDPKQINAVIKYTRIVLPQQDYDKLTIEHWLGSKKRLTKMEIREKGSIEDCHNSLLVDFANKYLGGGVMEHGAVQEEILFLIMPELLITRFLCDRLADNEALLVENLGLFSEYEGYSGELHFSSPYLGREGKFGRSVVAIDALPFSSSRDQLMQFHKKPVLRELNKAYIGFNVGEWQESPADRKKSIATGRWGCGAFRGNAQLKMVIQWLAASEAGKSVIFHCYEDPTLVRAGNVVKKYEGKTVGELFAELINFDNYFYDTLLKDKKDTRSASDVAAFDTLLFNFLLSQP